MPYSQRIYRLLLKMLPAGFREEYGEPLERQFRDEHYEAHGIWGHTVFWGARINGLGALSARTVGARTVA